MFIDFVFIVAGLLLLIPLLSLAKAQRKKILAWAVPLAVEIAKIHGWVSASRLMTQANITEKDEKTPWLKQAARGCYFKPKMGDITRNRKQAFYPCRAIGFARRGPHGRHANLTPAQQVKTTRIDRY